MTFCACGCGKTTTIYRRKPRKFLQGHFIKTIDQKGPNSRSWNGGRYKHRGYWYLYMPEYFSANKYGYVTEHVYNFQEFNKCCMCKWGDVHHIIPVKNGGSNLPWNLQGMKHNKHRSIHNKRIPQGRKCSECGSDKTYINGNTGRAVWRIVNSQFLCMTCFRKQIPKK